MITHAEFKGFGDIFCEYSENSQYFSRMNGMYFGQIDVPFEEDIIGEKDIDLVEIQFNLINVVEMINDHVLDFITFDDFDGDISDLYVNFIGDENERDKNCCIWKPFVKACGFSGNIIYIHKIKKNNGGNNVHAIQVIEDIMKRFSHNEGITVWCKATVEGWDLEHEKEIWNLLRHMDFKLNPLDNNWLFTENDRIRKTQDLKKVDLKKVDISS